MASNTQNNKLDKTKIEKDDKSTLFLPKLRIGTRFQGKKKKKEIKEKRIKEV